MNNKYYIYRHLKPDCGEVFYIGMGTKYCIKTFKQEFNRAFATKNRNKFWNNVYNKYGFDVEIMFECNDLEKTKQKEIEFIHLYGRRDKGNGTLTNLTDGGDYGHDNDYNKENNPNWNNRWSNEQKEKLSKKKKKYYETRSGYGKGKTLEEIHGNEEACEIKKKMRANHADFSNDNHPRAKKVKCLQDDCYNNTIYPTIKSCAIKHGYNYHHTISEHANGNRINNKFKFV